MADLVFVAALAAVPLVVYLVLSGIVWLRAYRRRTALLRWAHAVGWQLVGSDPALARRWRGMPFGIGDVRRVSELLVGTYAGRPAMSFRYDYRGAGDNRATFTHHVLATALPASLPTVELTPDGIGAKIRKAFGGQDIRFESEAFNRAWWVMAEDERFAHSLVHPRLMERLLEPDARGLSLRVEGTDLLCWSNGAPRLATIGPRLQVMAALIDQVPRFVWLDHGHDPDAASPPTPSPSGDLAPPDATRPGGPSWNRFSS